MRLKGRFQSRVDPDWQKSYLPTPHNRTPVGESRSAVIHGGQRRVSNPRNPIPFPRDSPRHNAFPFAVAGPNAAACPLTGSGGFPVARPAFHAILIPPGPHCGRSPAKPVMTTPAMSSRLVRQCFPMYSTGIPGWISETLRAAGLVIDEMTTAKWQAELRQAGEPREMLVLFDSRTAASRDNAAAFQQRGCRTVDVAALLRSHRVNDTTDSSPRIPAPRRLRVLERAKQQIESAGFLWARVADFPYPFQAALVDDRVAEAAGFRARRSGTEAGSFGHEASRRTILLPAVARERLYPDYDAFGNLNEPVPGRADVDSLYAQYVAGHALCVAPESTPADAAILDSALGSGLFPLLWRTTAADYANWRQRRREFRFEVHECNRRYEIRYERLPVHDRPAVELWRGGHFAVVPLQRSRQIIDAGQVVYQSAGRRHPAGLAGLHADLEPHASLLTAAARAV
jgi:hypothetical protein